MDDVEILCKSSGCLRDAGEQHVHVAWQDDTDSSFTDRLCKDTEMITCLDTFGGCWVLQRSFVAGSHVDRSIDGAAQSDLEEQRLTHQQVDATSFMSAFAGWLRAT